jgi:hypothetical protein
MHPQAIDFFKDLARSSSLPPNLEKLAIKWALEDEYYDDIPTLRELKDVLLSRHASLSKMWFDVTEYLLSWRKLPDGTVVEEEAEGSYGALIVWSLSSSSADSISLSRWRLRAGKYF